MAIHQTRLEVTQKESSDSRRYGNIRIFPDPGELRMETEVHAKHGNWSEVLLGSYLARNLEKEGR